MKVWWHLFLLFTNFYYIHKNIGILLQKIVTNNFSAVGCFCSFFFFYAKHNITIMGEQEWARWTMLPMPYPGYIADNPSILSLWRLLNFSRYYMFGWGSMVRAHAYPAESLRFEPNSMPWLNVRSMFTQQQMGTQWEQWGDKDGEERNWQPYLTRWWLSVSVLFNRHSPTYESIREYGNKLMEY